MIRRVTTRPIRPCIGVDPGSGPGAVAVWTPWGGWYVQGWRKWAGEGEAVVYAAVLRAAHRNFVGGVDCAVELIAPHKGRTNGLVALAEAAGGTVTLVRPHVAQVQRPAPAAWRRDVLGLSTTTGAAECEAAAVAAVAGVAVPGRRYVVDLGVGLTLGGHEAEAVCLALWAAGCRLGEPEVHP
jgi:hypothetical protein